MTTMFRVDTGWHPNILETGIIKRTAKTVTYVNPRWPTSRSTREMLESRDQHWFDDQPTAEAYLISHCEDVMKTAQKTLDKYQGIIDGLQPQ